MTDRDTFSDSVRLQAQRLQESGPVALSGLYDLTAERLIRFAAAISQNQHDAEDAVQAVLVQVAGKPHLLSNANAPWSYLLRMTRNETLRILRGRDRGPRLIATADLFTRRCVDLVEREDTYRAIWAALRSLPVEQSEVVVLKIWESLTFAEIAEILDVSLPTAASRYRYALQKLARKLGTEQGEVADV